MVNKEVNENGSVLLGHNEMSVISYQVYTETTVNFIQSVMSFDTDGKGDEYTGDNNSNEMVKGIFFGNKKKIKIF